MEPSEQREFMRVPLQVRAEVRGGGLVVASSATRNLSLKGLFVACTEQPPEGTDCEITLVLGEGAVRIQAEGSVVRCYPDGIALQFTRVLGLESFEHLRNLILYNSPDPDRTEDEFDDATGIHRRG